MNLYIIVEGRRTEPALLRAWIPHLAPGYREVRRVEDADQRCFFIVAGNGYPSYLRRIQDAVADLRDFRSFAFLLILVDAEDLPAAERRAELERSLEDAGADMPFAIFVADCCVETWLLGNRDMIPPRPRGDDLRALLQRYDLRRRDPEGLPSPEPTLPRARHHCDCLQAIFKEHGRAYHKHSLGPAAQGSYVDRLRERCQEGGSSGRQLASLQPLFDFFGGLAAPG